MNPLEEQVKLSQEQEKANETARLDYLNANLDTFVSLIDFAKPIEDQNLPKEQGSLTKEDFEFLKKYTSAAELKDDLEKVLTLRKMGEISRTYGKGKETVLTNTRIKESVLDFEIRVQLVRDRATNPAEAALLWYAINFNPEMSYDNLNLEDIFSRGDIDENGIAISNDKIIVSDTEFDYDQKGLTAAIAKLRKENKTYGETRKGTEIADTLASGIQVFEGIETETKGMIESYESSPEFQKNYALLQRIMLIPEGMLNSEIGLEGNDELGLDKIENIPDFAKEGTWHFGRVGGKFYARTIPPVEKGVIYVFDMQKGWTKTDEIPETTLAMPELYTEQSDGTWEINQKALEMAQSLGLNPNDVLVKTINVLFKKTSRNPNARAKLLDAFAFYPIPGATIPFPKLDKVEIILDEAHYRDSLTNIQNVLHTAYIERFPGLKDGATKWLAGDIGQRFLTSLMLVDSRTGKPYVVDQNGSPMDNEHKYILSSKMTADNFPDAFRPDVQLTAEKQFSKETQARIDQIHAYVENMYSGFFGKINAVLIAKFGVVGETIGQFAEEWARQPLGDVWKLAEELSSEWETVEEDKGKTLTFKEFMVIYGVQALGKFKDPSKIEEGSFLDRVYKMFKPTEERQSATTQAAPVEQQQEQSFDMTDPAQWQVVKTQLEGLPYSFGSKAGQRLLTDADVNAIVTGNTDKKFTTKEAHKAIAERIKSRMNDEQDSAEKEALKQEYDYYQNGKMPADHAATAEADAQDSEASPETTNEPATGKPGSTPDKPIEISSINTNTNYLGWQKANKTLTIKDGQFKVDALNFINNDAEGEVIFDNNVKIEIVYKDKNTGSSIASDDGETDTYDRDTAAIAAELLTRNNNALAIGKSTKRITRADGKITTTNGVIKEIRIHTGVGLKNPHLNKLT